MKKILVILLLSFCYSNSYSQSDKNELVTSCCEEGRGCKGSSFCSACKNCTGCKHCAKNGDTCGVCSSSSSKTRNSSNKSKSYRSSNSIKINFNNGDVLYVISNTLNLREGPSTRYKVIEKLSKSSKVPLLKVAGSWLKIKVQDSKSIGYVYAKYLRIN